MKLTQFTGMSDRRNKIYYDDELILSVNATFNSEHYKRIHFKDLQSIHVLRTTGWIWIAVLQVAAAALTGLISFAAFSESTGPGERAFALVLSVIPIVTIVMFFFNIARGPTCRTFACSAVQRMQLYAINRVRRADTFLRTIEPKITAAQKENLQVDLTQAITDLIQEPKRRRPIPPTPGSATHPGDVSPSAETATDIDTELVEEAISSAQDMADSAPEVETDGPGETPSPNASEPEITGT